MMTKLKNKTKSITTVPDLYRTFAPFLTHPPPPRSHWPLPLKGDVLFSFAATRTWTCATRTTRPCTGTRTCAPPWQSTATSSQTRPRSCCTPHPRAAGTTRPTRLMRRAKMAAAYTAPTISSSSLCTECTLWPLPRQAAGEVWFRHTILSDMTSSTAVSPHMSEQIWMMFETERFHAATGERFTKYMNNFLYQDCEVIGLQLHHV